MSKTQTSKDIVTQSHQSLRGRGLKLGAALVGIALCVAFGEVQKSSFGALETGILMGLLALVAQGVGSVFRHGDRHLVKDSREVLQHDLRPPILLLRPFSDDFLSLTGFERNMTLAMGQPITGTIEEYICQEFSPLGPVIAIGRPNQPLPPLGAARFWAADCDWRGVILDAAAEAQYVVMIMGDLESQLKSLEGFAWEVREMLAPSFREKLILVVPPISDDILESRWAADKKLTDGAFPDFQGGELFVVPNGQAGSNVARINRRVNLRDMSMYANALSVLD
jgi:hypothetical protein